MSARAERRAIAALFAVFALLVQALIPSIVLAASSGRDADIICVSTGVQFAHGGTRAPQHHAPVGGCDHCVCPVAAAAAPSAASLDPGAVRYAGWVEHLGFGVEISAPGRGLAAPPPPSRGPPSLTA
jgi:hypothetical protein